MFDTGLKPNTDYVTYTVRIAVPLSEAGSTLPHFLVSQLDEWVLENEIADWKGKEVDGTVTSSDSPGSGDLWNRFFLPPHKMRWIEKKAVKFKELYDEMQFDPERSVKASQAYTLWKMWNGVIGAVHKTTKHGILDSLLHHLAIAADLDTPYFCESQSELESTIKHCVYHLFSSSQ